MCRLCNYVSQVLHRSLTFFTYSSSTAVFLRETERKKTMPLYASRLTLVVSCMLPSSFQEKRREVCEPLTAEDLNPLSASSCVSDDKKQRNFEKKKFAHFRKKVFCLFTPKALVPNATRVQVHMRHSTSENSVIRKLQRPE